MKWKNRAAKLPKSNDATRFLNGGDEGDRTPYLLHAMQALSQVSYTPTESTHSHICKPSLECFIIIANEVQNVNCFFIDFCRFSKARQRLRLRFHISLGSLSQGAL